MAARPGEGGRFDIMVRGGGRFDITRYEGGRLVKIPNKNIRKTLNGQSLLKP